MFRGTLTAKPTEIVTGQIRPSTRETQVVTSRHLTLENKKGAKQSPSLALSGLGAFSIVE